LLPERLDDYIADNSHVCVVDVFIDELDLMSLDFKTIPEVTGRPGYHRQHCYRFISMVTLIAFSPVGDLNVRRSVMMS
jgi:hypothetical protein